MPAINPIKILGHLAFAEYDKRIPHNWLEPRLEPQRGHFAKALDPSEKIAIPNMPIPFFKPENLNKYHQEACNEIGAMFRDFHDAMNDGLKEALDKWRMQAGFTGVQIAAVVAIGPPGCLVGPDLESLIVNASAVSGMTGQEAAFRDAVGKGVGMCFQQWQTGVTIPGLPLYPAFAAVPSPVAPPTPNVPIPLIACPSPGMVALCIPGIMQNVIAGVLDKSIKDKDNDKKYKTLFAALEATLNVAFMVWLATQQVTNLMGTGPVPSFAPPVAPVGPVVGGMTLPGKHLMA